MSECEAEVVGHISVDNFRLLSFLPIGELRTEIVSFLVAGKECK